MRRLVTVSAPHPLRLRRSLLTDPFGQLRATRPAIGYQVPLLPERRLTRNDGSLVGKMLRRWSGPGWPDDETARGYREAFRIPTVAHCALEYHRWFGRSQFRPDGLRFARAMRPRSRPPPCSCTARSTAGCCRAPPRVRAATWPPPTGGG